MSDPLIEAVRAARKAAISILPPREDGSKRPIGSTWEQYQSRQATNDELRLWYTGETAYSGIGWVCGKVSSNLEVLDFDERSVFDAYADVAEHVGLSDLVGRLQAGYRTDSPNGVHLPYRCDEISGNTKLAQRPKLPEEMRDEHDKVKTLIETRGEGGYIIEAPTNGKVNPDGAYVLVSGSVETIITITPDEREALHNLARSFDKMVRIAEPPPKEKVSFGEASNTRPGDAFNQRASWADILQPFGWTRLFTRNDGLEYWRKPGKRRPGWSATVNYGGSNLLYVFSTATAFESEQSYTKFGAYTLLNYNGDYSAAASKLADDGYGDPPQTLKASKTTSALELPPPFPVDALPKVMASLVRDGAEAIGCPPEFIAVPLIVAAGAAIGNAGELRIKQAWVQGSNIFAAVVGAPGTKKTPGQDLALWALNQIQANLAAEYKQAAIVHKRELKQWQGAKKGERGPEPEPPRFQHVLTTDTTVEALAVILGDESNKGVLVHKDEMVAFVRGMDQYRNGRGTDRQHYLSMWSRTSMKVDRKSSPVPVIVAKPCVSVVGGIQPDLLGDLADAARREDGFIDRLLWSWPDTDMQQDTWTEDDVSREVMAATARLFERLHRCVVDGTQIEMTLETRKIWADWYNGHAAERSAERFPSILRGPWAKMDGQLARLAVILHHCSMDQIDNWLRPETLLSAIEIVEYFKSHARRVYAHLSQQRGNNERRLLAGLKEHGELSTRDITKKIFAGHISGSALSAITDELEAAGLISQRSADDTNGRPAAMWRLA